MWESTQEYFCKNVHFADLSQSYMWIMQLIYCCENRKNGYTLEAEEERAAT